MLKKISFILVALALVLSACERSATTPTKKVQATPTNGISSAAAGDVDLSTPIGPNMGLIEQLATQTALAGGGQNNPQAGTTETPATLIIPTFGPSPTPGAPATNTPMPSPTIGGAQPTVAVAVPDSYTLHTGEFAYCIARRFNVNPDDLLALNHLTDGQIVYAGTTLKIPKTGGVFPGNRALKAHPAAYIVQSGDTFYSIACLYGDVTPENIARVNGLSVDAKLTTGQTIQIP
jgi:LysM repeat protein